jgi:membrane protease YdiL (CAAX protease family)
MSSQIHLISQVDAAARAVASTRSATAPLLPVAIVFLAILVAAWTPIGTYNTAAVLMATISILWFTASSGSTSRQLGLAQPLSGIAPTVLAGVLAVLWVAAVGLLLRAWGPPHPVPWNRAWQYGLWAVMQEFIFLSFFYTHLERVLGPRPAVFWAAVLFAVVHIPNPILTILTFIGGMLFCELFRRYRNVYPLGFVHAALGLTVAATLPDSLLHHMRVGLGYLLYR